MTMTLTADMRKELLRYLAAERQESVLFMLVGVAALALAVFLFRTSTPLRGMAFPLALIAIIQIVVGATVYFRTPAQVRSLGHSLETEPARYRQEEVGRMRTVMKAFVIYRWIEIACLLCGISLIALTRTGTTWSAIGLGLTLQSALMLLLDFFAERRGSQYLGYLRRFQG